jgi:acyl carrier protein
MANDDIYDRLNKVFREVLDDDSLVLRSDMSAKDVDGWDSMANVQLMLGVEREFGIHLSAGQIQALHNVGDLASTINAATAGR